MKLNSYEQKSFHDIAKLWRVFLGVIDIKRVICNRCPSTHDFLDEKEWKVYLICENRDWSREIWLGHVSGVRTNIDVAYHYYWLIQQLCTDMCVCVKENWARSQYKNGLSQVLGVPCYRWDGRETVLSLTWGSLYWYDDTFILRRPPGHLCFVKWLAACPTPNHHHLNQCWININQATSNNAIYYVKTSVKFLSHVGNMRCPLRKMALLISSTISSSFIDAWMS